MTKVATSIIFALLIMSLSLLVFPVMAQIAPVDPGGPDLGIPIPGAGERDAQPLIDYIQRVVNVFLALVGIIAAAFIVIGGVQYITAAGDEKRAESAKKTVLYAVIGLILVGLSVAIVNFVFNAIQGRGDREAALFLLITDRG
jgi:cytochrome bd-type quinol oxidase subunit 2